MNFAGDAIQNAAAQREARHQIAHFKNRLAGDDGILLALIRRSLL